MTAPPATPPDGAGQPLPPVPRPSPPPRARSFGGPRGLWKALAYVPALVPAAILVAMAGLLLYVTRLALLPGFFSFNWDPPESQWGVGVFVVGSFLTAVPALVLSMAIGLGIAIASTTYLPRIVSAVLDPFVDLLAGIPSVVYGIWAFLIVAPLFGKELDPWAYGHLRFLPGFGGQPGSALGTGLPISIVVLTLMALPITTLLIRDALRAVPRDLWESGLALGATRWEVVRRVAVPYSARGILSAAFLGFGRAFGETVAVAMVIGSIASLPTNVYGQTFTIAAAMFQLLDTSFVNHDLQVALVEMALVLLAITLVVNLLGRRLISNLSHYEVAGL